MVDVRCEHHVKGIQRPTNQPDWCSTPRDMFKSLWSVQSGKMMILTNQVSSVSVVYLWKTTVKIVIS